MTEKENINLLDIDTTEQPERRKITAGSIPNMGIVVKIDGEIATNENEKFGIFHSMPVILYEGDEEIPAVINFSSSKLYAMMIRNKDKLNDKFRLIGVGDPQSFEREYKLQKIYNQLKL